MFEGIHHTSERGKESENIRESLARETLAHLREYETPEHYIDHGGAGEVYAIPSGYCIKVTSDMHHSEHADMLNLGNSVKQEAVFLERLSMIRKKGNATRTPVYVGYAIRDDGKDLIIMERLDAVNMQWVMDGRSQLPPGFDIEQFFSELESYLDYIQEKMHISHGDIAARNIMIDRATGAPRLIDFGRSRFHLRQDERERDAIYQKDWDDLQKVYDELRARMDSITLSKAA
jgi:serine/threonine protein kinase